MAEGCWCDPDCGKGPEFEYYGQALQAAADGVGVAMGIRPYIDDDLLAGRLVTPFSLTVAKGKQCILFTAISGKSNVTLPLSGIGLCTLHVTAVSNTIEFEHLRKIPRAKSMDYVAF